jgi:3',5'-nucleoside bisphosphate phosphatase
MRIDLHIHSSASDGAHPPGKVVSRARAGGLDLMAIADHDTVAGVVPATDEARGHPRVIPAIEISAVSGDRHFHVLGYFIDPDAPPIKEYCERAQHARVNRMREMIGLLAELDVPVDLDTVLEEAGADVSSLARPHLARVLHAAGHVDSVTEAFDRFIGDHGPAFVATRLVDVPGAIQLIHEAGGLAVWAHPPMAALDRELPAFVDAGLDGLECYRPRIPEPDLKHLLGAVRRHDLVATGGSDWHGDWHGELGAFHLGPERLHDFLERGGL